MLSRHKYGHTESQSMVTKGQSENQVMGGSYYMQGPGEILRHGCCPISSGENRQKGTCNKESLEPESKAWQAQFSRNEQQLPPLEGILHARHYARQSLYMLLRGGQQRSWSNSFPPTSNAHGK